MVKLHQAQPCCLLVTTWCKTKPSLRSRLAATTRSIGSLPQKSLLHLPHQMMADFSTASSSLVVLMSNRTTPDLRGNRWQLEGKRPIGQGKLTQILLWSWEQRMRLQTRWSTTISQAVCTPQKLTKSQSSELASSNSNINFYLSYKERVNTLIHHDVSQNNLTKVMHYHELLLALSKKPLPTLLHTFWNEWQLLYLQRSQKLFFLPLLSGLSHFYTTFPKISFWF